jgi:hypothetical protein
LLQPGSEGDVGKGNAVNPAPKQPVDQATVNEAKVAKDDASQNTDNPPPVDNVSKPAEETAAKETPGEAAKTDQTTPAATEAAAVGYTGRTAGPDGDYGEAAPPDGAGGTAPLGGGAVALGTAGNGTIAGNYSIASASATNINHLWQLGSLKAVP